MTQELRRSKAHRSRQALLASVAIVLIVMSWWVVETVDTLVLNDQLQAHGLRPRDWRGLDGVIWAPFLHSDFGHLVSNTFPFIILSTLVLIRGFRDWLILTVSGWLGGGFLTWLFASGGVHIGASGVVFTYFGALLGAAAFERKPAAMAPALVTLMLYTTMLVGLVPQERISWEGHLAGFTIGIATSWFLVSKSARDSDNRRKAISDLNPIFGDDEPWLD